MIVEDRRTPSSRFNACGPDSLEAAHLWSVKRACLLAALAVAALTVYGSLVPFDLRSPDLPSPSAWLRQVRFTPVSLTDLLVNAGVGVPLGFFLMAAVRRSGQQSWVRGAAAVLAIGCASAILATGAELVQVLSPTRKSSWNDVVGQEVGAVLGAVVWMLGGRAVIQWLRHFANERESTGFATRLLQLYLPIYLIVQLTPVDATLRAVEPEAPTLLALRDAAGNALLNIPIGALAVLGWVKSGTRRPVWRAILFGLLVVVGVGIAQEFASWRGAEIAEILVSTIGVLIGVAAAAGWARPGQRVSTDRSHLVDPWLLLAAGAWVLVLVGQAWYPPDFKVAPEVARERLIRTSLVPFASYRSYEANPFQALHDALLRFLLALPMGLLLRMACPSTDERRVRRLQNLAVGGAAGTLLLGIELQQIFLPMRFPDVTNGLIGALGAFTGVAIGAAFARRQSGRAARN